MTRLVWRTAFLLAVWAPGAASAEKAGPSPKAKTKPLDLGSYTLKAGPIVIEGIKKNASGITYNPDDKCLLLVINKPKRAFEITAEGKNLREIFLSKFNDAEGITYLGGGQYALVEEKRRTVCILPIPKGAKWVRCAKDKRVVDISVVTGEYDLMVYVTADSLEELSDFVTETLAPKKEIIGTYTHIMLSQFKREGMLLFDDKQKRLALTP